MGTRVLIEFSEATAPVFPGTPTDLFYWPSRTGPQQVPTGKEGYLLSEKGNIFIPDFSGTKTSKNMKTICPARKPSGTIEQKRKGVKSLAVQFLLTRWSCTSAQSHTERFTTAGRWCEGPSVRVGEEACTCYLVAASKVQLWKFLAAVVRPSGQCFDP